MRSPGNDRRGWKRWRTPGRVGGAAPEGGGAAADQPGMDRSSDQDCRLRRGAAADQRERVATGLEPPCQRVKNQIAAADAARCIDTPARLSVTRARAVNLTVPDTSFAEQTCLCARVVLHLTISTLPFLPPGRGRRRARRAVAPLGPCGPEACGMIVTAGLVAVAVTPVSE